MAPKVIPITVTAAQAATGVDLPVKGSGVEAVFRIPPCRDGDLIPAYVAGNEVRLRIVVAKDRSPSPFVRDVGRYLGIAALVLCVLAVIVAVTGS
ncbi:hypothetical protein [Streptomyces indicus]|uniref:Uncharacterized protein n=1 Tax=Streptomyces indicus TaxID=417292 RepID=A0A1G9HE91_9ACTN|nr:hypothetical protein [Streptomyces indicus]SDL11155.1 hypothetical protein SAMN05421806_118144 [Streptomyces indicus]